MVLRKYRVPGVAVSAGLSSGNHTHLQSANASLAEGKVVVSSVDFAGAGFGSRDTTIGLPTGFAFASIRAGRICFFASKTRSTLSYGSMVSENSTRFSPTRSKGIDVISLRNASQHSGSPNATARNL